MTYQNDVATVQDSTIRNFLYSGKTARDGLCEHETAKCFEDVCGGKVEWHKELAP